MRIPKLRLHATGQWMVKIEGKCKYLGTKKEAAEKKYRELIVEHFGPSNISAPVIGIPISELLRRYIEERLRTCPTDYIRTTRSHVFKQMSEPALLLYGNLPANDFGPKAYKAIRQVMSTGNRSGNQKVTETSIKRARSGRAPVTRSVSYVNMLCSRLKSAFKWGVGEELLDETTYRRLCTVPDLQPGELGLTSGREVLPVSEALYRATVPFLSDTLADFLQLLWLSGCRPGELLRLSPAELAKEGDYLVYRPKSHKTARKNKLRAIVFGSEGIAILRRYWPDEPSKQFFALYSDAGAIRTAIYRACTRAKLPKWHPYQLRHAAITRIALAHGKDVAQSVGGHTKMATTENYDHGAVERAKRAAG